MSDMREIEGKNIDDAIERACGIFGVPREKLKVEILAEGDRGFLGLGAKPAVIRAGLLVLDMADVALMDLAAGDEAPPETPGKSEVVPVETPPKRDRDRQREAPKAKTRPQQTGKPEKRSDERPRPTADTRARAVPAVPVPPESLSRDENGVLILEKAKGLLEGILSRMGLTMPVSATETEDAIILNVEVDPEGLLIGKKGQNLDAIQYLINKATNKGLEGRKMIVVDTEAYRERRETNLVALAERLGNKVKKTKKPIAVGNMNPHDRRIIHMTLQSDPAVTTVSRGEGEFRKIIIMPARREKRGGGSGGSGENNG